MDTSGWRVAGYLLEEPLGRGGQARVWRGRVRRTGDPVAIKLVPVRGHEQRDAARAEAALLAALDHPHLVHLHETVVCSPGLALVLDLAAGGSLADLLTRRGRLTPGEVITAVAPIGAALAYAHNADVVHGDVSAANVVFTDIGLPLLADLGVSRLVGDLTAGEPVRCTPAYADPSVAGGGLPSPASDVFALAGVALHALTGEPTWPAPTAAQATAAAARGDIGDVRGRLDAAAVPEAVAVVVCGGLNLDPRRRPTAAEFALDLRHAAAPAPVDLTAGRARPGADDGEAPAGPDALLTYGHRPPPPAHASARPRLPGIGSRPARIAAAGLLLAGAIAGLLWWAHVRSQPPGRPAASGPGAAVAAERVDRAAAPASEPAGGVPSTIVTGTVTAIGTMPAAPPPARLTAADARRVLGALDGIRARAYAQRDPELLRDVYSSVRLRAQDSAQLRAIVPAGCGLTGVHTAYRDVTVVARHGSRVTLRADAALRSSRLVCGGTPAGTAAAGRPMVLHIVVQRVGGRYLIAALRS